MNKTKDQIQSAVYRGKSANEYLGFGVISFYRDAAVQGGADNVYLGKDGEKKRFLSARKRAADFFKQLYETSKQTLPEEDADIFDIYGDLCMDEDLLDAVLERIEDGQGAASAVLEASEVIALTFLSIEDEYISQRASDIRNTAKEIVRKISEEGREQRANPPLSSDTEGKKEERRIIIADDLTPADTMRIDTKSVSGFVIYGGSGSSHTSILARSLGIPCIIRAERIDETLEGAFAVIDAKEGVINVNPDVESMREYAKRASEESENGRRLEKVRYAEPISKSGRRMHVYANIGSLADLESSYIDAAGGCGLFRSEFLFLESQTIPSEEEQFSVYKQLCLRFGRRPAIIRVLDIGADKIPSYIKSLSSEENPALGVRGIRFLLREKELFRSQLRAIIRASAFGNAAIMLPMITNANEILEVRELIAQIKNELRYNEIPFSEEIPLGIMVETPAAAIMSESLADHCDFFSIGTNDLCQYTLAADRQNSALGDLIEENLEPVFRLIKYSAEQIHAKGGWIGICGEAASNESLTERFLDMGIDELSVSLPYVLKIKQSVIHAD